MSKFAPLIVGLIIVITIGLLGFLIFGKQPVKQRTASQIQIITPPTKPVITASSPCASVAYLAQITWTGASYQNFGFLLEVSQDKSFASQVASKTVSGEITSTTTQDLSNNFVFLPDQTYYARVFNGKTSQTSDAFRLPLCN